MNASPALPASRREAVNGLVEKNLPLVGHLVRELLAKVPLHVSRDELTSAGRMALVVAAQGYEEDRGVPFARYASIRIRGALLDELRSMDWAARSVRTQAREMDNVQHQLAATLGRVPTSAELAGALGIAVSELESLQYDVSRARTLSLQGFAPESGPELVAETAEGPEALLILRERLGYLHQSIDALPERLRFVVIGYFFEQRPMADLAADLGVTESRVSQLRAEALRVLRDGMDSQLEPAATDPSAQRPAASSRKAAYLRSVAGHGTLASRLASTTALGDVRPEARPRSSEAGRFRIA
jgi:RNA polymerase sigma factor FliA